MADKEEKHEEGAEGTEGGKSKKPIIIIVAVIVVLVIVGVVVAFMMMKSGDEAAGEGADGAAKEGKKPAKEEKHAKKGEEGKVGPMLALDKIVVNLVSETGTRYVKVSVAVEMDSEEVMVEATARKAIFQDIIISTLSSKTADELITPKGKEACKSEILEKINPTLKDGGAKNIYFTDFLIQ